MARVLAAFGDDGGGPVRQHQGWIRWMCVERSGIHWVRHHDVSEIMAGDCQWEPDRSIRPHDLQIRARCQSRIAIEFKGALMKVPGLRRKRMGPRFLDADFICR